MNKARALFCWCFADLFLAVATANPLYRMLALLAALNLLVACGRRDLQLKPLLRMMVFAGMIAIAVNILLGHSGDHIVISLPFPGPVTVESMLYGMNVGIGVAACGLAIAPLFYLIEPTDLAGCLPARLHRTATAISGTMLLIPGLARSAQSIREARLARGVRSGGRISALYEIAVPVCLTALEDSIQRAEAMESRGYGSGVHTEFITLQAADRWRNAVVALTAAAVIVIAIVELSRHAMRDWYPFPSVTPPSFDVAAAGMLLLLLTPLLVWNRSSN